jgi:hypothetical protein
MLKTWSIAALLTLFGLCAQSQPAQAWGRLGHLVVCDLAYRNLTEVSKAKLIKLFNGKKGITVTGVDGKKKRHYTSFNLGCLEEDERPRRHKDDHFINVDRDTKSIDGKLCPHNATCIFAGIDRDLKILKDEPSPEKRVLALMAVGHWVGDIHQPLHISFADDQGGNLIDVNLQGKCGTSGFGAPNLHAVWDGCLLDVGLFERVRQGKAFKKAQKSKKKWGLNTIAYRAVSTLRKQTSLTEQKSLVGSQPWEWAAESYAITLRPEVLYCVKVGQSCQYSATIPVLPDEKKDKPAYDAAKRTQKIDQAYLASFERLAEERVKKAGYRLAHLLNQALDPAYKEPTQKP